ncbi:serine hydrolase domain-containing protein [Aliiglaciecola sp. LCG003]|uniref:serine hydrolase n=1 Tax=Aliiglaciecola sp. LCG003 TaxID=3053655 RepID=UPI00257302E1|nr:serine hydrolase domain-containing protein [Aliiglaciecola sp. LCG003]WJG10104.1 serine hydrolase domain-containing protein [Aliiglaciecola sp. LCG003]
MQIIALLVLLLCVLPAFSTPLDELMGGESSLPKQPLQMAELVPDHANSDLLAVRQGKVTLVMQKHTARLRPINSRKLDSSGREVLPDMVINWAQSELGEIIPDKRHLILSDNPYWDYFVGVGMLWPAQQKNGVRRVSMPFALVEKNENCVHNGVVVFDIDAANKAQHFYYQISSETCAYFKADFWGIGATIQTPEVELDSKQIIASYHHAKQQRLFTRPLRALTDKNPKLDVENFGLPKAVAATDMSVFGLVIDDVHYVSDCQTRAGLYPFCEQMVLPSYSTAKTLFAGVAMLYLEKQYGDLFEQPINKWVAQCQGSNWEGVTFAHLLDMSSGNFDSAGYAVDEASKQKLAFFTAKSNQQRLDFACNHYSRKKPPGSTFVYHTSETYLLGAGLNAYIKEKLGKDADIFNDVLHKQIFQPLGLSQITAVTRRTQDSTQQPYSGYGLFFSRDDLVRLIRFIGLQANASQQSSLLSSVHLQAGLQQNPENRGLTTDYAHIRYQHSFWAKKFDKRSGCKIPSWVPFMSGFGGITLALLAHGNSYYYVSDSHQYDWSEAVPELNKLNLICDN